MKYYIVNYRIILMNRELSWRDNDPRNGDRCIITESDKNPTEFFNSLNDYILNIPEPEYLEKYIIIITDIKQIL